MLVKIIVSLLIAAALSVALWAVRGVMLTPVRLGKNQSISVVLTVSGASPELENTVDAIMWLKSNGTLPAEILVKNEGMDEETVCAAELLQKAGHIKLII